jgi:hypothetical protein
MQSNAQNAAQDNDADICLVSDFLKLASQCGYDDKGYPLSEPLQNFIKKDVLTAPTKEQKVEQFLAFSGSLVSSFTPPAQATAQETFEHIKQSLPEKSLVRHAVDKVGLQLSLRKPI